MKNNNIKKSKLSNFKNKLDFWATNSEEGGWNVSSTDEGSQKMLENENEKQIKIQTGTEVVDDFVIKEETSDDAKTKAPSSSKKKREYERCFGVQQRGRRRE